MKKAISFLSLGFVALFSVVFWQSCSKSSNSSSSSDAVLVIQTGAQTIAPASTLPYTAVLVDKSGNVTTPSSVSWSCSSSSIGSFTGNSFVSSGTGCGTITASTTVGGKTISATIPIGVFAPTVFSVVPSAVMWTTGAGTIPLTPVYFGTSTGVTYSYSSSDGSIASVSSTGVITFNKAGSCTITVTANGLTGNPTVVVPVLVVGMPTVSTPVCYVSVTPPSYELYRSEVEPLTAKAYDMSNNLVSSATFTWASQNTSVATVDATGRVTAVGLGRAIITATASGIVGQAEVEVLPDTAIFLTPLLASIPANGTRQFTATTYAVAHNSSHTLSMIPNPPLTWSIPTYGISMLDVATVSSTGLVSMKSTATMGMSSFVIAEAASPTIEPGVAILMVSNCNCGADVPGVTGINATPSSLSLSIMSGGVGHITANTVGATGTVVFCSDSPAVCNVGSDGTVTAVAPGNATITICCGSIQTTVSVTVTL